MKRDNTPKIFDVARPSRSSPGNTSRPVIVGHRPQMADPMMHRPIKPPAAAADPPAPAELSVVPPTHHSMLSAEGATAAGTASIPEHHQAKIISVSENIKNHLSTPEQSPAQPQPETPPPAEPSTPEPLSTPPAVEANAEPSSPKPATEAPAEEASKVDTPGDPDSTTTAQPNVPVAPTVQQPASAEPHHQTLPMGHAPITSTKRLKHMILWLFVVVFLVIFVSYLAIDSGFISTSINLPFHIFSGQA